MSGIFADSPETKQWFDALATVTDEEKSQIQIPDDVTWREWLEYCEIPGEDIEAVIATTPLPGSELYDILQSGAALVLRCMGKVENPYKFAALANFNDPASKYFFVQLTASVLPYTRAHNAAIGIPDAITQATVADLGRNVRVHRKREGVGGLQTHWWLSLHFRGMIFQLGRLQFERRYANVAIAESMRKQGVDADEKTHLLSVHIPDFMGSMDHDACSASIEEAVGFHQRYFPDWPVEYGYCSSWLLDPQLKSILKPISNIILFQDRFMILPSDIIADETVMQFVFGKHARDIDTITPRSTLERGIINHLREGRNWHAPEGWFSLPT